MNQLPPVRLRAIEPEDLEMLYLIENDREMWNVGVTNVPYSRYALHEYLVNITGDIYVDRQVRLIVETLEGNAVGLVDLVNFNPQHLRAEVGIVIQKQYGGQGFGRAALIQLLQYARDVVHLHQLYALIDERNAISMKTFGEAGFRTAASLADWLYDGKSYRNVALLQYFL